MQGQGADQKNQELLSKVGNLESELSVVNASLRDKESEIMKLQGKILLMENKIKELTDENNQLRKKCAELKAEVERLELELRQRNSQLEFYNLNLVNQDERNKQLENQIFDLQQQLNEYQANYQQLEDDFNRQQKKLEDLENKSALLSSELDRVGQVIKLKNGEIEKLKRQIASLELEKKFFEQQIHDLLEKMQRMQDEIIRLNEQLKDRTKLL